VREGVAYRGRAFSGLSRSGGFARGCVLDGSAGAVTCPDKWMLWIGDAMESGELWGVSWQTVLNLRKYLRQ